MDQQTVVRSAAAAFLSLGLAATVGLGASGCLVAQDINYFGEVMPECDYREIDPPSYKEADLLRTTLRPECKELLEAILPFDETWAGAPAGLKDKLLEAFQFVAAFPLKLPREGRLFGVAPYAIPLGHYCIFDPIGYEDECLGGGGAGGEAASVHQLNRNLFNYLLARIDRITYDAVSTGKTASMGPSVDGWLLTIANPFWSPDTWANYISRPFIRASTLVHEARHADSRMHDICTDDADLPGRAACDPDLTGPYGLEMTYLHAVMGGAAPLVDAAGDPVLTDSDMEWIMGDMCGTLTFRFYTHYTDGRQLPPELNALFDENDCGDFDAEWAVAALGLERPSATGVSPGRPLSGSEEEAEAPEGAQDKYRRLLMW
ncbi:MAG: hypothetical protein IT285_05465 [Bdellovibrionales bacterium]|nr:hypothetical protein [Bdellovibrionales bacterium]